MITWFKKTFYRQPPTPIDTLPFPKPILGHILSYLPKGDNLPNRLVSKQFKAVIDNPHFWNDNLHVKQALLLKTVAIANGRIEQFDSLTNEEKVHAMALAARLGKLDVLQAMINKIDNLSVFYQSKIQTNLSKCDGVQHHVYRKFILYSAACHGQSEIVQFLLNSNKELPFQHYAEEERHAKDKIVRETSTALMYAAAQGHSKTVKVLLKDLKNHQKDCDNRESFANIAPLFLANLGYSQAIAHRHVGCAKLILQYAGKVFLDRFYNDNQYWHSGRRTFFELLANTPSQVRSHPVWSSYRNKFSFNDQWRYYSSSGFGASFHSYWNRNAGKYRSIIVSFITLSIIACIDTPCAFITYSYLATQRNIKSLFSFLFSPKTDEGKYRQQVKILSDSVQRLFAKFSTAQETLIVPLKDLLDKAPNPKFDEKGMLTKQEQPIRNKLQILQWEQKRLEELDWMPKQDQKSTMNEIREKAKTKLVG